MDRIRLRIARVISLSVIALCAASPGWALGDKRHVATHSTPRAMALAKAGRPAAIYVDDNDYPGVVRAAASLGTDLKLVTGGDGAIVHSLTGHGDEIVVIGTLGHSEAIDRLVKEGKLDVSQIRGHWEMSVTQVVEHPFPGVDRALVIAGADKRGTIFGVYDLSEQIGVSPWAWWADVPVPHKSDLYVEAGRYLQAEPKVKYRGIFLNDEAPALSGWAKEKFGGLNHRFYEHVFELLLRLKANFLWPAMWNNAFATDDPLNAKLADEYGIVMSTSHEEPMMRAEKEWTRGKYGAWDYTTNEKAIDDFWHAGLERDKNYEQVITLGMRGANDTAMSAGTNTELLEKIVADQRKIISETINPDVSKVPQVWCLYKEVQTYYEKGMRVPDDVTLLWSDDNWGNLRRLPTAEERKRPGGAGIYYHFDYVGGPRSYKWLNTNYLPKIWEQMNLAVEYGADRIWVVNVGDLKPMEFPIEFFLSMARQPERWDKDHLQEFTELWATREFGSEHAVEIADLMSKYTRNNARRKPEQLDPTTFSLTEDHEADRVERDWKDLAARAELMSAQLPESARPAFFELVLHPIKASAIVSELYIAAGRNQLYARQGRASANYWADEARRLFASDAALTDEYNHKLLGGKWDHMMDQTHIGYTFWNEPPLNAMPAVQQVQPLSSAAMSVFAEGSLPFRPALPVFDAMNRQTRTIDLANRETQPFRFTATASAPWIHLSETAGEVPTDKQLAVTIDWSLAPVGLNKGEIVIRQEGDAALLQTALLATRIAVQAMRPAPDAAMAGFVENSGVVAMEAEHATATRNASSVSWQKLPGFGETLSGMETFPVTAESTVDAKDAACLDYDFYLWDAGNRKLESVLAPTLQFVPGRGLRFSVGVDGQPFTVVNAWATDTLAEWEKAVSDGVHKVWLPLGQLAAGQHRLHLCRVDAGIVLERLVITGDHPPTSYLGPPESVIAHANTAAGRSDSALKGGIE